MIESDRVQMLEGEVEVVDTPSSSGKGQKISRCPKCRSRGVEQLCRRG